jgi:hypothetical protein
MGTAESRSVSLRVQLSTAPMSLVPMRSTATRGVVCGSSPLRRRQFRLLIWSSAAEPRAGQAQQAPSLRRNSCFGSARPGSPARRARSGQTGPAWLEVLTQEQATCSAAPCTAGTRAWPGALKTRAH